MIAAGPRTNPKSTRLIAVSPTITPRVSSRTRRVARWRDGTRSSDHDGNRRRSGVDAGWAHPAQLARLITPVVVSATAMTQTRPNFSVRAPRLADRLEAWGAGFFGVFKLLPLDCASAVGGALARRIGPFFRRFQTRSAQHPPRLSRAFRDRDRGPHRQHVEQSRPRRSRIPASTENMRL